MKKALMCLAMALSIAAFSGVACAKEVIIANGCDFPLHFIGLSKSDDSQAENLISEPVKPGDGIKVDLKQTKDIDLTVQDDEGTQVEFSGLDLSNASTVILKSDGTADIQ